MRVKVGMETWLLAFDLRNQIPHNIGETVGEIGPEVVFYHCRISLTPITERRNDMEFTLKNEHLTVQLKDFGGALSSIKDSDGVEYLWQGDATYWSGQAPVLFPICGSLRDDRAFFHVDGQRLEGHLPRHGLVRKKDFVAQQISDTAITFTIAADNAMLQEYPYPFELQITYILEGSSVDVRYDVINKGKVPMPYFIGGHPGFNCPLLEGDAYEDYYLEFDQEETCTIPRNYPDTGLLDLQDRTPFLDHQQTLDLTFDLFTKDAVTLDQLHSRSVALKTRNHSKGIQLDFADFPFLILWSTANQGPFIALEPWNGLSTSLEESDDFQDKIGVHVVEPGATATQAYQITVLG